MNKDERWAMQEMLKEILRLLDWVDIVNAYTDEKIQKLKTHLNKVKDSIELDFETTQKMNEKFKNKKGETK